MPSTPQSKNSKSASKQQEKPHLPSPSHDDQETQTNYTLSSEPAIQRMQRELVLLRETITKQNEKITSLERKLGHFNSNIVVLESQLPLANHVADVLRGKWDDQEQYFRRACLVIEGIRGRDNETEASLANSVIDIKKSDLQLPGVTINDVYKCHRIEPTDDGKQNIIIKFTKHSTATKVFRERWKLSKLMSWKEHVKLRSSLTRHRQNLLTFARNLCAEAEEINVIFSDINGNSKLRFKEPVGNRQVYSFRNKMELAEILAKLDLDGYQLVDDHDFDEF